MTRMALPKPIKSKNPVTILKRVIQIIHDEPKRYDQSDVIQRKEDYRDPEYADFFPTCGTVCCVAGWTNILTGASKASVRNMDRAARILDLTTEEKHELFGGVPYGVRQRSHVTPRQHASDGIKHIKRFVLKKWGKKL